MLTFPVPIDATSGSNDGMLPPGAERLGRISVSVIEPDGQSVVLSAASDDVTVTVLGVNSRPQ